VKGQGLTARVRGQGVRGCSGLGTSWSKGGERSKIQLSGAKHRNTESKVLRGLEADLDAGAHHVVDQLGAQACIAPGLQETPGEVLG